MIKITNKVTGKQLKYWADTLKKESCGCCYMYIAKDDSDKDWAIVMGWLDGFDETDGDYYQDGSWKICSKIAFQNRNCIMQCDYDIDWEQPCNEYGDVDDTEISIRTAPNWDNLADYLNKEAERIVYSYAHFDIELEEVA